MNAIRHFPPSCAQILSAFLLLCGAVLPCPTRAQGIPEPPLIFYGAVTDNRTAPTALKTNGTLRVVLTSSTSEQIIYSTSLQPIDGNNSYILAIPTETTVPTFSESPNPA